MLIWLKMKYYKTSNFFIDDVDINNILLFGKVSSGEKNCKYFIGYMDDHCKIKPFSIILPKFSAYVNRYDDESKCMYFWLKGMNYLKKYNDIWNKFSNNMKKEFDSEPIYIKKFVKTKIKPWSDEALNFDDKEMPEVGSNFICLAIILIDFVLKKRWKCL